MYDARCFSKQGDCQFEFCITYSRTPVVFAPSSPNIPFVFIINWTVRGETWAPGRIYLLRRKIILTHIISFEHSAVWIYKRRLTLWIGKNYNNFLPRNSCKNDSKEKHRERTCVNLESNSMVCVKFSDRHWRTSQLQFNHNFESIFLSHILAGMMIYIAIIISPKMSITVLDN